METDIRAPLERLRRGFHSGRTRPAAWRREQLERLRALLRENEPDLLEALAADLGKSRFEGWGTEIGFVLGEVNHALKRLRRWMRPRRVRGALMAYPGVARVQPEPLGVVLILGAWNYPLQLVTAPLVESTVARGSPSASSKS